jgi:methionine-gamma-lyase
MTNNSEKTNYKKTHIDGQKLRPETQMMSYGYDPFMSEGAVKPPIFLTSTFAFRKAEDGAEFFDIASGRKPLPEGKSSGLIYSRFNHPNLEIIEDRLALLEGGEACNVFSSGMAAISAVFLAFLKPGDSVVHSAPLYGGTETMIHKFFADWKISSAGFQDGLSQAAMEEALENAVKKGRVGLFFIESPANPTNALIDFVKVNNALNNFEKKHGYRPISVCDNTLLGPIFQKPVIQGIDISCYSLTKYVGGHSDLIAGAVIGNKEHMTKVRSIRSALGSQLDPHSCWMIGRSLETLVLRMERAAESAKKIATWLANNKFSKVRIFHPDHIQNANYQETYRNQCSGAGSTFAFAIEGGREKSFKFINSLSLFKSAVSLGGSESLICHPASTTHSGVAKEVRELSEITEGLIRVSIGLEHPDDLINDLEKAFKNSF